MTRILWDAIGSHHFSTGVDRGILFLQNGSAVPWNGLVAVNEAPSGADVVENYMDGRKFFSSRRPEEFSATIEAFTYPLEFDEFDGRGRYVTGQTRKSFGFSYRTYLGDDLNDLNRGYLIHIVYNALVAPASRSHKTIATNSDPNLFSWSVTTTPREISGRIGSHLIIDTTVAYPWAIEAFEDLLYGTDFSEPSLPEPEEILALFENAAILKITDNGDDTWTADGPDEAIVLQYSPWVETRRNLFRDPLTKTVSATSWGSTAGAMATVVDSNGKSWIRFTRGATGNVRLADMKVGTSLVVNTKYRFSFTMLSSVTRDVDISYRSTVTSAGTAVPGRTISLVANVPKEVDYVVNIGTTAPTSSAGLTIIQNGTTVGDTLDITDVNVEINSTATGNVLSGDDPSEDWKQASWLGTVNASVSILQTRVVSFAITWPSVVYLSTDEYQISSL